MHAYGIASVGDTVDVNAFWGTLGSTACPDPLTLCPADLGLSQDGSLLVSIADDKSIKIFDVANIDMMAMLRLSFLPSCAAWIFKVGLQPVPSSTHICTRL
jgi:hypothetical protein